MAKNTVENLKRIAKFLKVTPGTIGINNEKVELNLDIRTKPNPQKQIDFSIKCCR